MQAKVTDGSLGVEVYDCQYPWPQDSSFRIHESKDPKLDFWRAVLEEKNKEEGLPPPEPRKPRYAFIGYAPAPLSVPARNRYYTGRGMQRQALTFVGYAESFEKAEQNAFESYRKVQNCSHDWYRHTMSDDAKTLLMDGDCTCRNCQVYVHHLQMHDKVFNAMNLAHEAHDGQTRKYNGAPYITHPHEVYSRVAWWTALPEDQWVRMCAAAWLHDVVEDCPKVPHQRIIDATDEQTFMLVMELTNPSKGVKAPRRVRKQMDRDHIRHASWEAKIIKLFDRICNLRDMEKCPEKDFVALYAEESRLLWEVLKEADVRLALELDSWIRAAEKWASETTQ
jgi:hypothetical protein